MMKLPAIFLIAVLATSACSSHDEGEDNHADYDTMTDCLNGTMIVSLDGRFGLADTSGNEILPPVYDDIYYISDEIAAAFTGQTVGFFDRSGRRLGETMARDTDDVEEMLAAYSEIEKSRRLRWDRILTRYEALRMYCQSDNASADKARLMANEIRAELQGADGPMEKYQKSRFETECSAYKR